MEVVNFIKNYWTQIVFVVGTFIALYKHFKNSNEALKCSLRNDILSIYESCKRDKKITMYQLQAIKYSYEAYKKLNGNSFVETIVNEVEHFEKLD